MQVGTGGETPLMACASYGIFQVMSYLLAHGANANDQDESGTNVIQTALLAHGANANDQDESGTNVIQTTHVFGHSKCVELLLEHGADE